MKDTATFVVALVLTLVVALGADFLLREPAPIVNVGTTAQGGTRSTAQLYSVAAVLTAVGANATSSSVKNNTGNDLYLTGMQVGCEGIGTSGAANGKTGGLASLQVTMSTTSTAAPGTGGTAIQTITISTSTPTFVAATSTASTGYSSYLYVWPAGSYLTFTTNATNTAACTFGAPVLSS